jgi:thiamine biosynthesis lipoprotein
MATCFEVHVAGQDPAYAGQAAAAAFAELDRLEGLLSRFQESSEVSCINRLAPGGSMRVSPDTFDCLEIALRMHALTGGAFDPTLGRATLGDPEASGLPRGLLELDPSTLSATVRDAAVALDLGAIGKGFALDRMAGVLGEWGVRQALLVGGGSSVLALEPPPGTPGWEIALGSGALRRSLWLDRQSVGSSGTSVKGQHILDPITLKPPGHVHRTWALCDTAAESDALSTAWMCLCTEEIEEICGSRPRTGAILQAEADSQDLVAIGCAREALARP